MAVNALAEQVGRNNWLTTPQVAAYLGVRQKQVYQLCRQGKLRYFKIGDTPNGGTRLYPRADVERYARDPGRRPRRPRVVGG